MNIELPSRTKPEGFIKSSTLILIAFATAFFPRLLVTVGVPSLINFAHFATVPLVFGVALVSTKTPNKSQIATIWTIVFGLFNLLVVMLVSALFNQAGLINVIMDFLLLGEPILLLLAVIALHLSPKNLSKMQTWLTRFCLINLFLAYLQHFVIVPYFRSYLRTTLTLTTDLVQGVFFISGNGNILSAAISISFSALYFKRAKHVPLWIRITLVLASIAQCVFGDTKQVLIVTMLSWAIIALTKFQNIQKILTYIISIVLMVVVFLWCVENIPAFASFKVYFSRPEYFDLNSTTMQIKLASLQIIPTYYKSPLNWLLGLGPGHTVGRLGGWMLRDYSNLLNPLGATIHPASQAVWDRFRYLAFGNDIAAISTIFSPFWGWAGIWGDLGFIGIGAYLLIGILLWIVVCKDDFSKFLLINILLYGFVFTQIEEPGYMLYVAMVIGLQWHEKRLAKT